MRRKTFFWCIHPERKTRDPLRHYARRAGMYQPWSGRLASLYRGADMLGMSGIAYVSLCLRYVPVKSKRYLRVVWVRTTLTKESSSYNRAQQSIDDICGHARVRAQLPDIIAKRRASVFLLRRTDKIKCGSPSSLMLSVLLFGEASTG